MIYEVKKVRYPTFHKYGKHIRNSYHIVVITPKKSSGLKNTIRYLKIIIKYKRVQSLIADLFQYHLCDANPLDASSLTAISSNMKRKVLLYINKLEQSINWQKRAPKYWHARMAMQFVGYKSRHRRPLNYFWSYTWGPFRQW